MSAVKSKKTSALGPTDDLEALASIFAKRKTPTAKAIDTLNHKRSLSKKKRKKKEETIKEETEEDKRTDDNAGQEEKDADKQQQQDSGTSVERPAEGIEPGESKGNDPERGQQQQSEPVMSLDNSKGFKKVLNLVRNTAVVPGMMATKAGRSAASKLADNSFQQQHQEGGGGGGNFMEEIESFKSMLQQSGNEALIAELVEALEETEKEMKDAFSKARDDRDKEALRWGNNTFVRIFFCEN